MNSYIAIFYEADIYIENIEVPKVKKRVIDDIVWNQMIYRFPNIDDISFSYEIIKRTKQKVYLRVFCINTIKNSYLLKNSKVINISNIFLIQFCYINYFFKVIKETNYLLFYCIADKIYITEGEGNSIINTAVFEEELFEGENEDIEEVLENIKLKSYEKIYVANMAKGPKKLCDSDIKIVNLGMVDEDKLIKRYIGGIR